MMKNFIINFILFIGLVDICLSTSTPNWIGTFKIDDSCEQAQCCCLTGDATISKNSDTQLLVSSSVAGQPCHEQLNGSTTITVPLPIPHDKNGYQITTNFLGTNNRFTLSSDSQYIVSVNLDVPRCSDSAHRINGGGKSTTTSSIWLISIFLLINCLSFHIAFM